MAKKETEKKEFAWDTETKIGEFGGSKKKTEVRICTLNHKTYVAAQSYIMSAKTGDWKRTKNNTMEMSLFKELGDFVSTWEKGFEDKMETIEEKPKKALKAKHQAEGAKEKATRKKKEVK